jgi:uncharacterized membrane protein
VAAVRRTERLVIGGLMALALIGAASAIVRTIAVGRFLAGAPANELSPEDLANMQVLASWMRIDAGSAAFQELEASVRDGAARYNAVPLATLLHVLPGMVFLVVAPLQLIPRFRARASGVHRRAGYVLLALAVPYAITSVYLSVRDPLFGRAGAAASLLAGLWFVACGVRAYVAIRRGDIDRHRIWMVRALAMAYGIAVIRALFLFTVAFVPLDPVAVGALTFWSGWLLSALTVEWWLWRTTPPHQRALRWAS